MISGKKNFDQPVKKNLRTYDSIWKIATGQVDDYTTGYLLGYNYLKDCYKIIAIEALVTDPKAIQQINFTVNLAPEEKADPTMIFIIEEVKETVLIFSNGTVKVLSSFFALI